VEEVKRKGPNLPSDDHWGNFAHCKYRHLWRFVCCCLAPLICLFAERWLLPRQLGQLAFIFHGECSASLLVVAIAYS